VLVGNRTLGIFVISSEGFCCVGGGSLSEPHFCLSHLPVHSSRSWLHHCGHTGLLVESAVSVAVEDDFCLGVAVGEQIISDSSKQRHVSGKVTDTYSYD